MQKLELRDVSASDSSVIEITVENLIVAGWTGRDPDAMEAHIVELEKLGVARPKTTPIFYRTSPTLLTTGGKIQVVGGDSSGEAEPVVIATDKGLYLGVGSDHTDRKIEIISITISKQLCAKPLGETVWRLDDVADHWDELVLRSYLTKDGTRRLYQEGTLVNMRPPSDLMGKYLGKDRVLPAGSVMFCGTIPVKGEIEPADSYDIEIYDPILDRRITHGYAVETLPNEG